MYRYLFLDFHGFRETSVWQFHLSGNNNEKRERTFSTMTSSSIVRLKTTGYEGVGAWLFRIIG